MINGSNIALCMLLMWSLVALNSQKISPNSAGPLHSSKHFSAFQLIVLVLQSISSGKTFYKLYLLRTTQQTDTAGEWRGEHSTAFCC